MPGSGNAGVQASLAATLEADVAWLPDRLHVRYRIVNGTPGPLLVFDRGDTHAVMVKRQRGGDIALPQVSEDGRDMTLTHRGLPLPDPAPTLPPVPLVTQVAPGAAYEGSFELRVGSGDRPRRVRYCVGVAMIDAPLPDYTAFDGAWQAAPALVARQELVCTPWFEDAAGEMPAA